MTAPTAPTAPQPKPLAEAREALADNVSAFIAGIAEGITNGEATQAIMVNVDEYVSARLAAAPPPPALRVTGEWHLTPDGPPIQFWQCPIGLFEYSGEICLKSEYGDDAYIASSGEAFWGDAPQTKQARRATMVQPLAVSFPIQQDWQPITTAPKDGTHFLACTATVFLGELWWEPTEPQYDSGWFDGYWHYKPTHWQPLLRLPIQQDADDIGQQEPGADR